MRKSLLFFPGFLLLLCGSCATADKKIPEMAIAFCNCFTQLEKNVSSTTKEIMSRASEAAQPETILDSTLEDLTTEEKQVVARDMEAMSELNKEDSEIRRCMTVVEKKYGNARTFDKKKFLVEMIKE